MCLRHSSPKYAHEHGLYIMLVLVSPFINYFQKEPEIFIKYGELKLTDICKPYLSHTHKFNWIYPAQEMVLFPETIICQIKILCWVWDTFPQLLTKSVPKTQKAIKSIDVCCGLNRKYLLRLRYLNIWVPVNGPFGGDMEHFEAADSLQEVWY